MAKLATAQARVELIGGTLHASPNPTGSTDVIAELPRRASGSTQEARLRPPGAEPGSST